MKLCRVGLFLRQSYSEAITELTNDYKGHETPLLYICGDHDFFQMIPVDGSSQYGTSQLYGFSIWLKTVIHIYIVPYKHIKKSMT